MAKYYLHGEVGSTCYFEPVYSHTLYLQTGQRLYSKNHLKVMYRK